MTDCVDVATARHWGALAVEWKSRSQMAAEWLQDAGSVADIGCGLMTIEKLLPASTLYIPMDIVERDSRTIIVDLNKQSIPVVGCDVLLLLGVLEYIDDLPSVLSQLREYPRIVLNYNHISLNDVLWKIGIRKKRVTWKNRYTKQSFRSLLEAAELSITRERQVRIGEVLYEVRPSRIGISIGA